MSAPSTRSSAINVSSVAGRRVGQGGGIYQLTKRGAAPGGHRHVRSSLVEPGATARAGGAWP